MKKIVCLILAALLLLPLISCAGTSSTPGPAAPASSGSDIRAYVGSSPETIDPTMNSSMDGATYIVHLFQGLFRYNWSGNGVELGDAASYKISDDGLVWTFTLRDDIKWSDGKKVTAQDYEYSWKRMCNPDTAAPYAEDLAVFLLNGINALDGACSIDDVGVKALDEKTLEVKLVSACPFFDEVAVFPVFYPVRKDIVDANGDGWWTKPETYICNGPFKMTAFTLDEELVMVPNDNFYDVSKLVPASITFKFLADDAAALAALRAGEIELSNNAPPEEIPALKRDGLFQLLPQLGTYYLSFNCEKAPFDNPLVRKALTLAIDRVYISDVVRQGTFAAAAGMVGTGFGDVATGSDFRKTGGDYYSLDFEANVELAKQALTEAGYPDGEGFPPIEYMYNTSGSHQMVAEAIAKGWEDSLGIKVNLVQQEWNSFLDTRRKGNYEVARNGWVADWNDPSTMLTIFGTGGGNNDSNYSNPQFDKYMADSYATTDRNARMTAMHNAEDVLMGDWGCAPVMYYALAYVVKPELTDWVSLNLGYTMFHLASIAEG